MARYLVFGKPDPPPKKRNESKKNRSWLVLSVSLHSHQTSGTSGKKRKLKTKLSGLRSSPCFLLVLPGASSHRLRSPGSVRRFYRQFLLAYGEKR